MSQFGRLTPEDRAVVLADSNAYYGGYTIVNGALAITPPQTPTTSLLNAMTAPLLNALWLRERQMRVAERQRWIDAAWRRKHIG